MCRGAIITRIISADLAQAVNPAQTALPLCSVINWCVFKTAKAFIVVVPVCRNHVLFLRFTAGKVSVDRHHAEKSKEFLKKGLLFRNEPV